MKEILAFTKQCFVSCFALKAFNIFGLALYQARLFKIADRVCLGFFKKPENHQVDVDKLVTLERGRPKWSDKTEVKMSDEISDLL